MPASSIIHLNDIKPLAVAAYILVLSITPGPVNVMLAASGANFGYFRTLPHIFGSTVGAILLVVLSAAGFGVLFTEYPSTRIFLSALGALYLLYLAYKIAGAGRPVARNHASKPFSFTQATLFQLTNPKTWLMAANVVILFSVAGNGFAISVLWICVLMTIVNFPSISVWAILGVGAQKLLHTDRARILYNRIMALLLLTCIPLFLWN